MQTLLEQGAAWLCPPTPTGSDPVLASLSQVRVSYRGMQGLHSSMAYATNHAQN